MLKKRARFWLAMSIMVSVLALSLACGKKEEAGDAGGGGDTGSQAEQYAATEKKARFGKDQLGTRLRRRLDRSGPNWPEESERG